MMDFNTKEGPDVIILDEEDCPFTIVTVKIGEDGAIEETNEPVIDLDPPIPPTNYEQVQQIQQVDNPNKPVIDLDPLIPPTNYEQVRQVQQLDDSDKTDNSDDWTDDAESPVNVAPVQPKTTRKKQKKGSLRCPYCRRTFSRRDVLNDHVMTHTGEKPFNCSVCSRGFIQKTNLKRHIDQCHPSEAPHLKSQKITRPLNCWDCKISFTTPYDYRKHMKRHTNTWEEKQSSCFQVEEPTKVIISSDSDAAEITYTCVFCDREYPDEESLASHMAFHTGLQSPNSFTCKDDPADVKPKHQKEEKEEESDDEHSDQESPESFSCKYCGKQCGTKVILSYHERTHRIKRTFRCAICKRGFDKREAYDRHIQIHSASSQNLETFSCEYCGKQCDTKLTLSYHERTHRIERKFRCSVCRRGFDNRLAYDRHIRIHSTKTAVKTEHQKEQTGKYTNQQRPKSLNCKYCGKLCATERKLSYHERTHSIQRNYYCSICKKGFNLRQKYYKHMKMHSAKSAVKTEHQRGDDKDEDSTPRSLSCKYCGKFCPTEMNLSYHERSHKVKRTFRCSLCRRGFNNKLKFDHHVRVHLLSSKTISSEPPTQEESGNESSTQQREKSFQCKYCGKEFNKKVSCSYHERTHRIQRKFCCSICKKGFNTKVSYDLHFRKLCVKPAVQIKPEVEETDEKPLQSPVSLNCKYCGKYCDTKVSLSYHERTHKIKRSFRCFVCRRGFDSKPAYDRHVRIHQNGKESADGSSTQPSPKPYSCNVCGASFSTELSLSNHEETHRSKRTFCCSVCNKGFNRQQTYDRHIMHCTKPEKEETDEDTPPQSLESLICKYCGKQCDTKSNLSHHERTHKIKRKFHCSDCNQGFFSSQAYIRHREKHFSTTNVQTGELKPFRCDVCGLWFSTKAAFAMHLTVHNTELPYECSVCKEKFKYPSKLILHMQAHNDPFSCSVCDSTFSRREALNLHMAHVHKAGALKPFSCKDCGKGFMNRLHLFHHERAHKMKKTEKGFNQREEYDQHLRLHSSKPDFKPQHQRVTVDSEEHSAQQSPQSFSCNVCGKHFSKKLSLDFHVRRHKIKYPFPCSVCNKRFSKKTTYEEHMRTHADVNEESASDQRSDEEIQSNTGEIIFSCPHCDKELPTEQALQAHMNDHEKNDRLKPFSCDMCGARFEEKQWLESHMDIHNLNRISMFSCNICNQKFVTHSKYETHMKSHRKQRRFSCTVCNRSFSRRCKLEKHAKVHKEVKPFSCPVDFQKVSVNSALKRQTPPHEGEGKMSFICEDCGKQYSSRMGLEYHKRTHLQQIIRKTYHCSVCNIQFNKRLAYDWHIKVHCPKSAVETEQQGGDDSGEASPGFSCEDCGANFSTDESWDRHKRTHRRNYTFYCSICNRGFEKSDVFELHMSALHPKEIDETELENKVEN